jgi:dihydrofolate reductase
MAKLIYVTNVTLDGFIEDAAGSFDFSEPDEEVFVFITDLIRPVDTYLYGRRIYETMAVWETDASLAAASDAYAEFARVWQAADKVVYSSTLQDASTVRTRLERSFEMEAVRDMKQSATADLAVAGANLAAQAFEGGLVDEVQLFVYPAAVGRGKPGLPTDTRLALELLDERRFASGIVYLRYGVT